MQKQFKKSPTREFNNPRSGSHSTRSRGNAGGGNTSQNRGTVGNQASFHRKKTMRDDMVKKKRDNIASVRHVQSNIMTSITSNQQDEERKQHLRDLSKNRKGKNKSRQESQIILLDEERKELKEIVEAKVKSPRRRQSIQNIALLFNDKKIEQEMGIEERQRIIHQYEQQKRKKLEWRAQFQPLTEVPSRREKSEQRKVQIDLIKAIHIDDSERQFLPLLKVTFWEKLGFKNKKKEEQILIEAKDKIDDVYNNLKEIVKENQELKLKIEQKRDNIRHSKSAQDDLYRQIQEAKRQLQNQDGKILKAKQELIQCKKDHYEEFILQDQKLQEIQNQQKQSEKAYSQKIELTMMTLEDFNAKYLRIKEKVDIQIKQNQLARIKKDEAILLEAEEEHITKQLSMSKPLVTEIMEYFNNKEKDSVNEENIDELVESLQNALEECLLSEAKFQKAAYYDANQFLPFERAQRSPYVERTNINK